MRFFHMFALLVGGVGTPTGTPKAINNTVSMSEAHTSSVYQADFDNFIHIGAQDRAEMNDNHVAATSDYSVSQRTWWEAIGWVIENPTTYWQCQTNYAERQRLCDEHAQRYCDERDAEVLQPTMDSLTCLCTPHCKEEEDGFGDLKMGWTMHL